MKLEFHLDETVVSPRWNKSFTQVVLIVSSKDAEKRGEPREVRPYRYVCRLVS